MATCIPLNQVREHHNATPIEVNDDPSWRRKLDYFNSWVQNDSAADAWAKQVFSEVQDDYLRQTNGGTPVSGLRYDVNDAVRALFPHIDYAFSENGKHRIERIIQQLNGTSANDASWWLQQTTNITRKGAFHAALMGEWEMNYHGMNDRALSDQYLYSDLQDMDAKINGVKQKLSGQHFVTLDNIAGQVANRLGKLHQVNDVKAMLGDAANCMFILSDNVNQHYVDNWNEQLAILRAKNPGDTARIAELEHAIDVNTRFRNDPDPKEYIGAGYSDAQARARIDEIRSLGVTDEEMSAFLGELVQLHTEISQFEQGIGHVAPEQVAKALTRNEPNHLPLLQSGDNHQGFMNATGMYRNSTDLIRKREGMEGIPENAYTVAATRVQKVASYAGARDVAERLMVMAEFNKKNIGTDNDDGLRSISLGTLDRYMSRRNPSQRARQLHNYAERVKREGGFIAERPVLDINGNVAYYDKVLVYFDPNWISKSGRTGSELNESMLHPVKANGLKATAINVTSGYGQLNTRFKVFFAPVNTGRDSGERLFQMFNMDVRKADGSVVSGFSLIPAYIKNLSIAAVNLMSVLHGSDASKNVNDPMFKYYQEYVQSGLHQEYMWANDRKNEIDRQADENKPTLINRKYLQGEAASGMREALAQAGRPARAVIRTLDKWNDFWNNIVPFAQYITFRQAGVAIGDAAHYALKPMNLSQKGTATNTLRAFFPFVKPIAQSAAATARTLGLVYDPRGFWKSGWKGWAGAGLLGMGLYGLAGVIEDAMGKDEDGRDRIDQFSLSKLSRGIPIPIDDKGNFFFFNTGYGLPKLVSTLVWGSRKMEKGLLDPNDFAGIMLTTFAQEMAPGNWPEFKFSDNPFSYLAQSLCPSMLTPLYEAATNTNYFGNPIKRGSAPEGQYKADYGGSSSMKVYNNWAKAIARNFGVDMYPEQLQYFVQNVLTGPLSIFRQLWETDDASITSTDHYKATHLDPFAEMLGLTMSFGTADDVSRALFNQAERIIIKTIKDNGIKLSSDTAYKRNEAGAKERWIAQQCWDAGLTENKMSDILVYLEALTALTKGKKEINDSLRTGISNGYDFYQMKALYEELTADRREIYRNAVNKLSMFKRN